MPDTLGPISVPALLDSGLTLHTEPGTLNPGDIYLPPDFGFGLSYPYPTISHRFGSLATKAQQTFQTGIGPRRFHFRRSNLKRPDRISLWNFYEATQGSYKTFWYEAPNADTGNTVTAYKTIFDIQPLSIQELATASAVGFDLIECPTSTQTVNVGEVDLRFPGSSLTTGLLSQVQKIIPLVHIKVRDPAVPEIWLSDRRLQLNATGGGVQTAMGWTASSQLYLARIIGIGEKNSNVIVSQNISGSADNVRFTLANADGVMDALANSTDLKYATVDLCLLHVNTGVVLQLWRGFLLSYQIVDGSPEFPIQCSDGLYQVTQQYPMRTLSRQCWKTFNGVACPWASISGVGDPTGCDYYFASPNGCVSHQMTPYFGGQQIDPQGVSIKDNSTGVIGFGRNVVQATSIVSDTMWGLALADNWCNDHGNPLNALFVNCIVADVRDEGDFIDMLGIVGAGPVGAYEGMSVQTNPDGYKEIVAPLADGFPPHGFRVDSQLRVTSNSALGLREVLGNDPVNPATDSFSLGQTSGPGTSTWGLERAAGVAFVELRYAKPSGINPTLPDQHSMTIPLAQGLAGFTWSAGGSRSLTAGLTNPVWIAINTLIRALGLQNASSAAQLALFSLPAVITGTGAGAAEICDLVAAKILGVGTETQFQFQGTIAAQKPVRDWFTEILNCCLGWYTWEFGKLKIGIRENASTVSAFTYANMLFQSLTLTPTEAAFERLILSFADQAYQYQANTAEYIDKSHAAYYGRAGSPLTARMNVVGMSTLSQALRYAATRTREEVGGINAAEWAAARTATWKTTILALDTEVGQVVSITNPKVPGGSAKFRIQGWQLLSDWSIQLTARTVTDSMYDLTVGPKPVDVLPAPLPALTYPMPLGQWAPFQIQADAADALFPSEYTFDLVNTYTTLADGTPSAAILTTGKVPVNTFIPNAAAPGVLGGFISQLATGGALPGGKTYRVTLTGVDAAGNQTPPASLLIIQTAVGTNTNQFTLGGIAWPKIAGLVQYVVYASDVDDLISGQQTGTLTDTGGGVYTPTSITVLGPFGRSSSAVPNPNV